jgi:aspartyl-tRNA(Asn)/glutamyl-tRNA(Gln) amidotransferase subunit B
VIIEKRGLKQISDPATLEKIVDDIIAANPAQLQQYRAGKQKLLGYFVGQAMKVTKGKANPGELNRLLKRKLATPDEP